MNRQARIDSKVAELIEDFQARLRALGFVTSHHPANEGKEGLLSYQESRSGDQSCATCEETGTISEWFEKEHFPGRDGLYQVRLGDHVSFAFFNGGSWEGGEPDAWRGIDWRMSRKECNRLFAILRDRKHGSKADAALALMRHHLSTRSNDHVMNTLKDKFGIKEKIYCGVILRKDPDSARQVLHLVDKYVVEPVPENVRKRIEQKIANFDLSRD